MKKIIISLGIVLAVALESFAQVPNGFNYQAVLRDNSGQVLTSQSVSLRVSLTNSDGTTTYYSETHAVQTNTLGLVNFVVGSGEIVSGTFDNVPWNTQPIYINMEVKLDGSSEYTQIGSQQLQSVPYALYASKTEQENLISGSGTIGTMAVWNSPSTLSSLPNLTFSNSLVVVGTPTINPDDPIFEVKNSAGEVLLGVYQEGVRINIKDDAIAKGAKGGFAVGGLTNQTKSGPVEYLRITPDSARIYVKQVATAKGAKGGFAVGGLTNQTKSVVSQDMLFVAPDSARIYVNENITKGAKGGFAVGGLTNQTKSTSPAFIQLTPNNYLIGYEAGKELTSGIYNSFFGYQAGMNNTTGQKNINIGYQAGYDNNGSFNTLVGNQSGQYSQGDYNSFYGFESGLNTSGSYNVYLGYQCGYTAGLGGGNVFTGNQSGFSNTDGEYNVFIGYLAGYSNTTGWSNNFIGQGAGYANSTGTNNIFIGNDAGRLNQGSSGSIFIGRNAGYNSTEYGNTIIGHTAGEYLAAGSNNVFYGSLAAYQRTGGNGNLILGSYSNYLGGSGNNNTIVGTGAGYSLLGSGNVLIGYQAGYSETGDNKLYISNTSSSSPLIYGDFSGSGMLVVKGNASNNIQSRLFYVNGSAGGTTGWYTDSDRKLKQNIQPIQNALSKVLKLNGVNFEWIDKSKHKVGPQIGFIAQDVELILPEVVDSTNGSYTMDYSPITAVLVEAIKEQQQIIQNLKDKNAQLETKIKEIDNLKAELESIKAMLKK